MWRLSTDSSQRNQKDEEIELEPVEQIEDSGSARESQTVWGDSLPIVDLWSYKKDKEETHYVQINHIVRAVTEGKKAAESTIKKKYFARM